jgi:hypothetical protein
MADEFEALRRGIKNTMLRDLARDSERSSFDSYAQEKAGGKEKLAAMDPSQRKAFLEGVEKELASRDARESDAALHRMRMKKLR